MEPDDDQLLLLHARDDGSQSYNARLHQSAADALSLYNRLVRTDLLDAGVLPADFDGDMNVSGRYWSAAMSASVGQIVGYVVVRPNGVQDAMAQLTAQQGAIKHFWIGSEWSDSDVLGCRVVRACQIVPQIGEARAQGVLRMALFWRVTPFSAQRFVDARTIDESRTVGEHIHEWVLARRGGSPFLQMDLAVSLPMAYCMLLASGKRNSCGLPVPRCRRKRSRLGWSTVPSLLAGVCLSDAAPATNPDFNLVNVSTLIRIGDVLRACHANMR